jgi:hypothetical protein
MLEPPFKDLCIQLSNLRLSLRAVQVAVSSDEALSGSAREALAVLDEVIQGAERGRKASRLPVNIDGVRRALPRCQRRFSDFKALFYSGVGSAERTAELGAAGRHEATYYIGRCSAPLFAAERALGFCWRKVGEYSALNPGGVVPGIVPPA